MTKTSSSSNSSAKHHFLMIPLSGQGHLIPMVDIARLLAKRPDVTATIVTTPMNTSRFNSIVEREVRSGLDIRVLTLPFPHAEAGLPPGSESIDTLPSPYYLKNFMHALSLLRHPLEAMIAASELHPPPTCIISDKHVVWTALTSARFALPRILFDGMSCFTLFCYHSLHQITASDSSDKVTIARPSRPDEPFEMTRAQLPGNFNPGSDEFMNYWRQEVAEGEEKAYGIVVNSFRELEMEFVEEYEKRTGRKVWCVGPVSLCNEGELDMIERGNAKKSDNNDTLLKWLDRWGPGSVVYACLGSLNRLTLPQIIELGMGLEASRRPFVWVIRGAYKREEIERWLEEDRFEERVRGRGVVVRGWAPQLLILSHPSVGAFVSHCGWNSTMEAVTNGVPMVTWPLFAEQFLNEKFVVQVLETGVSVGAQKVVHPGEEDDFGDSLVRRERVEEGIEKVMSEGKEGEERRARAKTMSQASKKAIQKGGSSYRNITLLLQDVTHYVNVHAPELNT